MQKTAQSWTGMRQKVFGIPLQKMQKGADGSLIVRGYFTSDNKDEVGDIITRAATERALPKYRQWGNIRYMHMPRPVAKVVRIGTSDGLEWNEVEIKVIDPQAVFEVEAGLLTALSVGIFFGMEDIDFLEDGGLIINDYMLAEISLVDHPANYDAALKSAAEGLQALVYAHGMQEVAKSMQILLDKEIAMTEPIQIDAVETAPEEEIEEAPVEETEVVEPAEVTEEPVAAEADQPTDETMAEAVAEVDEQVQKFIDAMTPLFDKFLEAMNSALERAFPTAPEVTQVEAPTPEQPGDSEADKTLPVVDAGDQAQELGLPDNRAEAVEETVLPDAKNNAAQPQYTGLKAALYAYLTNPE